MSRNERPRTRPTQGVRDLPPAVSSFAEDTFSRRRCLSGNAAMILAYMEAATWAAAPSARSGAT
jgi:hypothetical protein